MKRKSKKRVLPVLTEDLGSFPGIHTETHNCSWLQLQGHLRYLAPRGTRAHVQMNTHIQIIENNKQREKWGWRDWEATNWSILPLPKFQPYTKIHPRSSQLLTGPMFVRLCPWNFAWIYPFRISYDEICWIDEIPHRKASTSLSVFPHHILDLSGQEGRHCLCFWWCYCSLSTLKGLFFLHQECAKDNFPTCELPKRVPIFFLST